MASVALQSQETSATLLAWMDNAHSVLEKPATVLMVIALIIAGTFVELCPRKDLLFLSNVVGSSIFFVVPLLIVLFLDWPTGLLAATVALIVFARIQTEDSEEGFDVNQPVSDTINSTKLVSTSNRWFVEKVLGERPVAISADKVLTAAVSDSDNRTNSGSAMSSSGPSDSSSSK
jgi:hypothetical protein